MVEIFDLYKTLTYKNEKIRNVTEKRKINFPDTALSEYLIHDWISPENLSYRLYGSCNYEWVLLELNNIVDPFNDWLLSENELSKKAEMMYKNDMFGIHHYEYYPVVDGIISSTKLITYTEPSGIHQTITNYQYLYDLNEKKRKIIVLKPEYIIYLNAVLEN